MSYSGEIAQLRARAIGQDGINLLADERYLFRAQLDGNGQETSFYPAITGGFRDRQLYQELPQ